MMGWDNVMSDSKSPDLLISGRTRGSKMDYLARDDVVLDRRKARKMKRTAPDGGHTVEMCKMSSSMKMQERQNGEGVGRDACLTLSHSSSGNANGVDLSIWHLVSAGSLIQIEKCTTGLRKGNKHLSLCTRREF